MPETGLWWERPWCAAAGVAAVLSLLYSPVAAAQVAPIAPATARVWFYQDQSPYVSSNYAAISMNGVVAALVQPYGGATYRDVAPGHYHLTSDTQGTDVYQSADVELAAGQEVYVKVMNLPDWATANLGSMRRDTFYLRLMPTGTARAELSQNPL